LLKKTHRYRIHQENQIVTTKNSTTPTIVFVDLDNPPASVQLNVGDELALVRKTAAGAPFVSAVDVPASEFSMAANMHLMVPLALIRLTGQPAHTYLVHHDIAQNSGAGQITFSMSPANPNAPGGTNQAISYSVI
jgi:hypothetical protein